MVGGCLVVLAGASAKAADIALFEYQLNQDGSISTVIPAGSSFDTATGLGTIQMTFTGAGPHQGLLFVDHELSETVNTFFNEVGEASGTPAAGQSWEIDEPGFLFGDIFDNFLMGSLDNSVGTAGPEDISMAMGWSFNLDPGQTGIIQFLLGDAAPDPSTFFLRHYDPDSGENVYLSSKLTIRGGEPPIVPEGDVYVAGGVLGLMALATAWRLRRRGDASVEQGK